MQKQPQKQKQKKKQDEIILLMPANETSTFNVSINFCKPEAVFNKTRSVIMHS